MRPFPRRVKRFTSLVAMDDQTSPQAAPTRDYRETLFLPDTPFPMRAGLPVREPETIAYWDSIDLYGKLRAAAKDRPAFVLHDGPPYANGHMHYGHALNNILKDFIVRSRQMMGFDVDFVPGWDCHGLPIEWKVEEEFIAKGRKKDEIPAEEFRARCREYAAHWVGVQMSERQRWGMIGDWAGRYTTMDFSSEATIAEEFMKVAMSGELYRGSKPVMWSPVERTALAEAEIEYHDKTSNTIWVKFPVISPGFDNAAVVIWTTTPWTIPGNRAISYSLNIDYGLYEVVAMEEDLAFAPWAAVGDQFVVADARAAEVFEAAKIKTAKRRADVDPSDLTCAHPLRGRGYDFDVPLIAGEHVTDDAGTGFVHTAPGHGQEDYVVFLKHPDRFHERRIPHTVDPDGRYTDEAPGFTGLAVLELEGKNKGKDGPANKAVMDALIEAGALLARGRLVHSYPHSWRSKAPIIFRNTPQWFVRMDGPENIRAKALAAIDETRFHPEGGRNRIRNMVEDRPDWLVSRQRLWGVPLTIFVHATTGEILKEPTVNARIVAAITEAGADAWYQRPAADFLGPEHDPAQWEKVTDILDVWFDSGCTHAFTLGKRDKLPWPADVYFEGSDQHRGWFQSSLLESVATRGRAPYRQVITHGFTLDEQGRKMSKSLGNVIDPAEIARTTGIEIFRLVVASLDYTADQRIGKTVQEQSGETYRKLRNTLRYLLGALGGFDDAERLPLQEMPLLERAMLDAVAALIDEVRAAYEAFDYAAALSAVVNFNNVDLSAFYVDVRKDTLYCDRPDAARRRATRTVLSVIFETFTALLAPLMPFTTEEAWRTRHPDAVSVHLRLFPDAPDDWRDPDARAALEAARRVRRVVTGALEIERREKRIGSSLKPHLSCIWPIRSSSPLWRALMPLNSSSPRARRSSRAKARREPSGSTRCPASPSCRPLPRGASARAVGRSRRMSAPTPDIRNSRRATPMRWLNGTQCMLADTADAAPRAPANPLRTGLLLAGAVFAADQVTKWWVLERLNFSPPGCLEANVGCGNRDISPFFDLTMVWNRGVSFGLLEAGHDLARWALVALSVVISIIFVSWLRKAERGLTVLALGLVIGGALGNVIDRIRFGAVADFLNFSELHFRWVFNIADAGITVGAILLLADLVLNGEKRKDA
jgi:isoleucyl-tRNA synthetase